MIALYYGAGVCVPSKFICWIANPTDNDIRSRGLWEMILSGGCILIIGINFLIKETPKSQLVPFCRVWSQWKGRRLWGSRLSPDTVSASTMILNFLASRVGRNKYVLLVRHSDYSIFAIAAPVAESNLGFLFLFAFNELNNSLEMFMKILSSEVL